MIDTHTHLYLPDFAADTPAGAQPMQGCCDAVDRAVAAGVEKMILPCVDRSSVDPMRELHRLRPDVTALAMGLHPTEVRDGWPDELAYLMGVLSDGNPYCAVGEIGIDLYWDRTFEDAQMQVFDRQLDVAARAGLPVIIHCREALDQTLEVLSDHPGVPAVFHSFGGTVADVDRIRALGDYYFGINGIVTFKNSGLRDVLPAIGHRPHPHRNRLSLPRPRAAQGQAQRKLLHPPDTGADSRSARRGHRRGRRRYNGQRAPSFQNMNHRRTATMPGRFLLYKSL